MKNKNICGFGQEIENCSQVNCRYYSVLNSQCNYHQIRAALMADQSFKNRIIKKSGGNIQDKQSMKRQEMLRGNYGH